MSRYRMAGFLAAMLLPASGSVAWGVDCVAGYFSDDFESYADDAALAAAGWQMVDVGGALENATWTITNPGGRRNPPTANGSPSAGKFLISDSDAAAGGNVAGSGMSHDLITPSFSTIGGMLVWLHVDCVAQLNNNGDAVFDIDVSTDGGATWTNAFRRVAPGTRAAAPTPNNSNADGVFGRLDLDLSVLAASQADVRLRFRHFEPTDDWFIAIDDLLVDCVRPTQGGNCVGLAAQGFSGGLGAMSAVSLLGNTGTETWHTTDKGGRYVAGSQSGRGVNRLNHPSPTPDFAIQDSDADPDPAEDEYLKTPVVNCATYSAVYLHFKSETVVDDQATQDVLLSLDGGATFPITLFSYNQAGGASNALFDGGEEPFYGEFVLPVPAAAGQANVVFAFHYKSPGDRWWWAVDDVKVTGNAPLCVSCTVGFFADNFDGYADDAALLAAGWQVVQTNAPVENAQWTVTNPCGRRNPPTLDGSPSTGNFIISDSDCAAGANTQGSGMSHDLITPSFATIGETKVWLHVDASAQLNNDADAVFDIDVSGDGGMTFTNAFRRVSPGTTRVAPPTPTITNADGYFGRLDLDISSLAANRANVLIRFRQFEPTDDWWVALDNVLVDCVPPPQGGNCEPLKLQTFSGGLGAMSALSLLGNSGTETWHTTDKGHRYTSGSATGLSGRAVNRLNQPGPTPDFAILESGADPDPAEDEYLLTPVLNCSSLTEVFLHYKDETVLADAATQEVLLSLDGGATVAKTVFRYNEAGGASNALFDGGEESMYAERVFRVPEAAGQAKVVFGFHYKSPGNQRFWAVDDVKVTGTAVLCDPCDCGLRNLTVSYDPGTNKVSGTFASLPCSGTVKVLEGARVVAELPGNAASFEDTAPPVHGTGIVYTLQSDRDCTSNPVQTYRCTGGLACRADQLTKMVHLSWTPAVNIDSPGYDLKRNGVSIATLGLSASSFNDAPPLPSGELGVFEYELSVTGADAERCPPLACRAAVSPGRVCLADDFEDYANDVDFELGGWFLVDEIHTPPGETGATWTVKNPGGRTNPPTFDGKASTGRFAISDSDFAGGDNGAPGSGNSNDLWSPVFSTSGKSVVWLHMDTSAQMNNNGKVVFDVDVSLNGGGSWTNVLRRVAPGRSELDPKADTTNADGFFGRLDVDLSAAAANKPAVQFRLRSFEPSDDWWIAVDNVIVDDVPPLAGGAETVFSEDFSGGLGQMAALSLVDPPNEGITTWNSDDPCGRYSGSVGAFDGRSLNRLGPGFAILDSDCDPDPPQDELLLTPPLDCRLYSEVFLHWASEIVATDGTVQEVLLSLDGGGTFEPEPIFSYNGGGLFDSGEDPFYARRVFRVAGAAGQSNVAFAFHYASGGDEWWWAVDDVKVTGTSICKSPFAASIAGATSATAGDTVHLTSSTDATGPATYKWTISSGDGSVVGSSTADSADVTSAAAGTLKVQLTVKDACGKSQSAEHTIEFAAAGVGPFIRGDCNGDRQVTGVVADAVFILSYNFLGGAEPKCLAACDANGDGQVTGVVADAVYVLNFNFLGGPAPPAPFPDCGLGTSEKDKALGCATPTCP